MIDFVIFPFYILLDEDIGIMPGVGQALPTSLNGAIITPTVLYTPLQTAASRRLPSGLCLSLLTTWQDDITCAMLSNDYTQDGTMHNWACRVSPLYQILCVARWSYFEVIP
jgi:hypothetical protein